MSHIVYYRPLPPDDGAEVPLDLHDSRTRLFRLKPRFPRDGAFVEEVFYRNCQVAWQKVENPEVPNGVIFAHFNLDGGCKSARPRGGPPPGWLFAVITHFQERTRGMARHECEPLLAPFFCGSAAMLTDMLLWPVVLIATADSRWIGRQRTIAPWSESIEDKPQPFISYEKDGSYRYSEVNPHFAALLWGWDSFVPPGPMPADLREWSDWTKLPVHRVRCRMLVDGDGGTTYDLDRWNEDASVHSYVDPYEPFDRPPRRIATPSLGTLPATSGRNPEPPTALTPPARALAAAYDLQREGKPISLNAACERAGVDRKHLRDRYPETVDTIRRMAQMRRPPRSGMVEGRTGNLDALDETED